MSVFFFIKNKLRQCKRYNFCLFNVPFYGVFICKEKLRIFLGNTFIAYPPLYKISLWLILKGKYELEAYYTVKI